MNSMPSGKNTRLAAKYVLITPARNEAKYLEGVVQSVASQTVRPERWVIISDSSTDGTDDVARSYAEKYGFIRFLRLESTQTRSFSGKVRAFREGFRLLDTTDYAFIGNLDADVTFGPEYYETQIKRMGADPQLGVCSGVCWDATPAGFKQVTMTRDHAVGAVQFFRRECFEQIGGYRPASVGGIDSMAVFAARMRGWKTCSYSDLPVHHHKPVGSASAGAPVKIALRAGETEFHIGTHPLFAVVKALRRWRMRPIGLSPAIRLYGYFRLLARRVERDAGPELTAFVQQEQMRVIARALKGDWKRI